MDDTAAEKWRAALVKNGHVPTLTDEGKIDMWAHYYEHHNGPQCESCYECWCEHCLNPEDVVPCKKPVIEAVAMCRGEDGCV